MVKPACAQSTPAPSVPEFTIKFVDNSYDVPTTSSIDPYTGQNVVHQGYHVNNVTLVMIISNQPFVYQYNGRFFYNIRLKGHYAENWTQFYSNGNLPLANASSTQTVVTLGALGESGLTMDSGSREIKVPFGGKVDCQVQAMIGQFYKEGVPLSGWFFQGETSDWSNTQTITISESQTPTPSPAATPTPTAPNMGPTSPPSQEPALTQEQLETIIGVAIAAVVIGAGLGLLIYLIKRK
jgi:hypothetical protein